MQIGWQGDSPSAIRCVRPVKTHDTTDVTPQSVSCDAAPSLMGSIGSIIRPMSDVVHIYGNSYETCPACGHKCPYDGGVKDFVSEPVIRPSDWEIELNCPEHGRFSVLAGKLIQPA